MKKPLPKFCTQTDAKNRLLELCHHVIESKDQDKVYVKDKAGITFLTIARTIDMNKKPLVKVPVQRFKDNFSRFCSLVKTGFSFLLLVRGTDVMVAVRAHTSYKDPLIDVIEQGFNQLRGFETATDADEDETA